MASPKRNRDLRDMFPDLSVLEQLVEGAHVFTTQHLYGGADYTCAWQKEMLLQGRLYITTEHVHFYTKLIWTYSTSIPIADITNLERKNVAGIFPSAIEISTKSSKFFFTSFLARDSAFDLISHLWTGYPNNHVHLKSPARSSKSLSDSFTASELQSSARRGSRTSATLRNKPSIPSSMENVGTAVSSSSSSLSGRPSQPIPSNPVHVSSGLLDALDGGDDASMQAYASSLSRSQPALIRPQGEPASGSILVSRSNSPSKAAPVGLAEIANLDNTQGSAPASVPVSSSNSPERLLNSRSATSGTTPITDVSAGFQTPSAESRDGSGTADNHDVIGSGGGRVHIVHQRHPVTLSRSPSMTNKTKRPSAPPRSSIGVSIADSLLVSKSSKKPSKHPAAAPSKPVDCPCVGLHNQMRRLLDADVPLPLDVMWMLIYGYDSMATGLVRDFWVRECKHKDIKAFDWKPAEITLDLPTVFEPRERGITFSELQKRGVKYTTQYYIDRNITHLRVSCDIEYSKSTWLKMAIDRAAPEGLKLYFSNLLTAVLVHVSDTPSLVLESALSEALDTDLGADDSDADESSALDLQNHQRSSPASQAASHSTQTTAPISIPSSTPPRLQHPIHTSLSGSTAPGPSRVLDPNAPILMKLSWWITTAMDRIALQDAKLLFLSLALFFAILSALNLVVVLRLSKEIGILAVQVGKLHQTSADKLDLSGRVASSLTTVTITYTQSVYPTATAYTPTVSQDL
eukprot:jgi/Hompol1/5118/HPOL_004159-RA